MFQTLRASDIQFAHRHSMFKEHPEYIIVGATLLLDPGNTQEIRATMRNNAQHRIKSQNLGEKCAGCMFKNPQNNFAGKLIDEAECKGMRMGGRMGGERVTVKNLRILQVDTSSNTLVISGAIPGAPGTLVEIQGSEAGSTK